MTRSDISVIKAMLVLIREDAKEIKADKTVTQLDSVIDVLDDKMKEAKD